MTGARTILIVDDYLDALDVWSIYLGTEGFRVLTASTGREALSIAAAELPDLVVLDLDLPDLSGFEVARELQSQAATRAIPLIAATGFSHAAQQDRARASGFSAVLVKPCDPDALVVEIHRLLATQSALSPPPIER
jgi:CheY-like chemotaxis protein